MGGGELKRRVAVAVVGIPLVLAALLVGGWLLGSVLAAVAVIATVELFRLAHAVRPYAVPGTLASGMIVLLATAYPTPVRAAVPMLAVLLILVLVTLAFSIWLRWPEGQPLEAVAVTLLGPLYLGCTLAFAMFLRHLPASVSDSGAVERWQATGFVLLPVASIWVGDSAAYFAGRAWGRRRLFPAASPGKTVVGGVAGLAGSTAAGALIAALMPSAFQEAAVSVTTGALIGALLGVVAPIGDAAKSVLKREAGVKDSGRLLPGHGGFLDRVDSLLFAFPVTYAVFLLLGVAP